jgi:hypothetical protein
MLADPITLAKGVWYSAVNRLKGCGAAYGVRRLRVEGAARVEALAWQDESGREHRVECDAVGASFGLRSETQLADLAGCRFVYDRVTRQWVPERSAAGRTSVPHVYIAGDGGNIGGADVAELQGERVAFAVLEDLGRTPDASRIAALEAKLGRQARFRAALERAYPFPDHIVDAVADDDIVCRCEGIRAGALREAATALDASEVNRLKAFTRIGMGRCQGRMCGLAAAELLARARRCDVAEAGRLRGQPPVKPVPILELTA